jgi:hypothetical protein
MASEKFANLAETTLSAGYTAGAGSISVTSAAGFPTVGDFRVRLGNAGKTILKVTSVSGTTFTATAEANDANASNGDTVVLVATRSVAERLIQSPDSGSIHAPSGVSAADSYGPIYKTVPFVDSGYSWINQGTSTIAVNGGVGFLTLPQTTGQTIRGRAKSLGAVPYTCVVMLDTIMESSASQAAMFGFRESGTAKFLCFRLEQSTVRVSNGVTSGTVAGDIYAKNWNNGRAHSRIWLKIEYDNTNVKFSFSWDGVNFIQVLSEAKATHFTTAPDQVCFLGYDQNNSSFLCLCIMSMAETF